MVTSIHCKPIFSLLMLKSEKSDSPENANLKLLKIFTDKESYIPGETSYTFWQIRILLLNIGGLDYTVTDPNGKTSFCRHYFSKL